MDVDICDVHEPLIQRIKMQSNATMHKNVSSTSTKQGTIEALAAYICSQGGFSDASDKVRERIGDDEAWQRIREMMG